MSSLRWRLWLTYALVVGIVLAVVAVGMVWYLIRNPLIDRQTIANLSRSVEVMASRSDIAQMINRRPEAAAKRADEALNARILLVSSDGNIQVDSQQGKAATLQGFTARKLALGSGYVRGEDGRMWLFASKELDGGRYIVATTQRQGGLRLLFSQRLREVMADEILPPMMRAGAIALLLALVLAFGIARWISTPLQRVAEAAIKVADGQYTRLPVSGPREVQEVAQAFNEMSAQVQASQQSQRDFVANVSHDLKTPLTSIQGYAQAILDGTVRTPDRVNQAAQIIYDESARMHRMVEDLLELARFDAGIAQMNHGPLDMNSLLQGISEKLAPQAHRSRISLELNLDTLPRMIGDADRLDQVFTNLVDNAIKYTPEGGTVTLSARLVDGEIEVAVADTGRGISPEEQGRIFERFYQTDKARRGGSRRGAGLGLSIAREIVLAHGGKIWVKNNLPQGSVFVVKLPVARPDDSTLVGRKSVTRPGA